MIVDKDCKGLICTDIDGFFHYLPDVNIKSIVTKEMFNSVEYRLEE